MAQSPLIALQAALGYTFGDASLLQRALTHGSWSAELSLAEPDYERLEFLGDAVIQLAVSDWLFGADRLADEGQLTVLRATVVRGETLAQAATAIGLGTVLRLGPTAERLGVRRRRSVLAAGLEAVCGAVYHEAGWETARAVALRVLEPYLAQANAQGHLLNAKGLLQELTQERWRTTPTYELLASSGPAHDRRFEVAVQLAGRQLAAAVGHSKREAEQRAAAEALALLRDEAGALSNFPPGGAL